MLYTIADLTESLTISLIIFYGTMLSQHDKFISINIKKTLITFVPALGKR